MVSALLGTLTILAVGRLALSFTPPGWPGEHGPRELAPTLAMSFVLGLTLLAAEATLIQGQHLAILLAPWVVLLVVRLLTLPGALRPRHEPRSAPRDPRAVAVIAVGVVGLALPWVITFAPREIEGPLGLLAAAQGTTVALFAIAATAVLVAGGLERGHRAQMPRALAFTAVAWLPTSMIMPARDDGSAFIALGLAAAGAGALAWIRRADRRGRALACIGLGASALLASVGWLFAAIGAGLLVQTTPRASRSATAIRVAITLTLACILRATAGSFELPTPASAWVLAPVALMLAAQATAPAERAEVHA